jgi:DNA-binding NarL/FixJ family response regulator
MYSISKWPVVEAPVPLFFSVKECLMISKKSQTVLPKAESVRPRYLYETLTPREFQIAKFLYSGMSNVKISKTLKLSNKTVSAHKRNIMRKLMVKNITEFHLYALIHDVFFLHIS